MVVHSDYHDFSHNILILNLFFLFWTGFFKKNQNLYVSLFLLTDLTP